MTLLELLDGPYRELRDSNHISPNEILVYNEEAGTIEAIDLMDLPLRYPCGAGERWSYEDLGRIVMDKALLYRQSLIATEISDEDPTASPTCGTVLLVITRDHKPYKRFQVKAQIVPEEFTEE